MLAASSYASLIEYGGSAKIEKKGRSLFLQLKPMMPHQKPVRFSREEAQQKLGRRVQTIEGVDGVPTGTFGCVMQLDEIEKDNFEVIVEWYVLIEGKRQHDWFSKEQYKRCLIDDPELDLAANVTAA